MVAERRGETGTGEFPPVQDTQPMPVAEAVIVDDTTDPDTRPMQGIENPFGDIPERKKTILTELIAELGREAEPRRRFMGRSAIEALKEKEHKKHFEALSALLTEYLVCSIRIDSELQQQIKVANTPSGPDVPNPLPKLIKIVREYVMTGVAHVAPDATEQIKKTIVAGIDDHIDRIITNAIQQINS